MAPPNHRHPLELRIPPPLVAGAAAVTQWFLTRGAARPPKVRRALSAAFAVAGGTIGARGLLDFDDAGTTFHPHHPETTTALVTTGVYSRTRNPMYLGMALGLLGIAIDRGRLIAVLPILAYAAFLQRFQILPEEQALRALFGQDYEAYARRVRRWV
jgi:protein-S-isoprenylcysteine O-methyltransferase Ste14